MINRIRPPKTLPRAAKWLMRGCLLGLLVAPNIVSAYTRAEQFPGLPAYGEEAFLYVRYSMAYHARLGQMILLVHDIKDSHEEGIPSCLYYWQNGQWQPLPGVPPAAGGLSVMVYDSIRNVMVSIRGVAVLFGGFGWPYDEDCTYIEKELMPGTWEYSGANATWREGTGATPPLRTGHTMAFDNRRNRIVMFGGVGPGLGDDTDEYTAGIGWTSLLDTGPPARESHAMVYDSRRDVMVVYGGIDPAVVTPGVDAYDDTWELDVCTRPPEGVVQWVDFTYTGIEELGTFAAPFSTLDEGVASIPAGGLLRIKTGTTSAKPTIFKAMTLSAYGGPVIIGQ